MYMGKTVTVVVPCKDEASQIGGVIETMPAAVDRIIVVDDGSTDETGQVVRRCMARRAGVELLRHEKSRGVGGAISAGYVRARDERLDITCVMAGDGQMDPADLERVLYPVAAGLADYSKGNRFTYPGGLDRIPNTRKLGNFVLSFLTKIATGYWHVSDTQTGYTALGLAALDQMDAEGIYPSYGCPNDILARLNIADARVVEVPVNPLYHVGERSKMRIHRVAFPILRVLWRAFRRRMFRKYVITSGHPLIFAYLLSFVFMLATLGLAVLAIYRRVETGQPPVATILTGGFCAVVAVQFLIAAFWMDAESNRHLCVHLTLADISSHASFKPLRPSARADGAAASIESSSQ